MAKKQKERTIHDVMEDMRDDRKGGAAGDGLGVFAIIILIGIGIALWNNTQPAPDYPVLTAEEALGQQVWDERMANCTPLGC